MSPYRYLFAYFLFLSFAVYAQGSSRVYFVLPASEFPPGAKITVDVLIDSDVPINAVSLEVGYTASTLAFITSNAGDSWISFWRTLPPSAEDGFLKLEGGMTRPFAGEKGEIIKLTFLALKEGPAQIAFRGATLIAADGKGTPISALAAPMNLTVLSSAPYPVQDQSIAEIMAGIYDTIKPEIADLNLFRNPADNALLLAFKALDRETGINSVTAKQRRWFLWEKENPAPSPLVISRGVWNVKLKATDNAGNVITRTVIVWHEFIKKFLILALVFSVAFVIVSSKVKSQISKPQPKT